MIAAAIWVSRETVSRLSAMMSTPYHILRNLIEAIHRACRRIHLEVIETSNLSVP